jgi:mannosyltransferase
MRVTSTDPTELIPAIPAQHLPERNGPTEPGGSPESNAAVALDTNRLDANKLDLWSPVAWAPGPDDLPPPPEPLEAPWLTVASWLVPLLVALGVGLIGLTGAGLGEDELATWGLVTAPWNEFWRVLSSVDASIAPYYVLLRAWVEVAGTTDVGLRLPSVWFASGAAALTAALGTRMGGRRVGLAAGMLYACLPVVSRYAQEARPYALTTFAAALSTLLLLRLLDRPRIGRYAAYAGSMALLGLAHAVALLLLLAHALIMWRRADRSEVIGWLVTVVVAILPAAPLLWLGSRQSATQIAWIPPVSWVRLADTPAALFGGAALAGAVIALALAAMSMRGPLLMATAWAVVPIAGLLAASYVTPLWVPRYLLFVVPGWVLLTASALRQLTILRGLVAVLAIGVLGVPVQLDVRSSGGHGLATKDLAAVLEARAQPGDAIVFGSFAGGDQRTSRDAVMRYVPAARRPADPLMRRPPRTGGRLGAQECLDRDLPTCFGRPQRVWVLRKGTFANPLEGIGEAKEQLLKDGYVISGSWRLTGFALALLVHKPTM